MINPIIFTGKSSGIRNSAKRKKEYSATRSHIVNKPADPAIKQSQQALSIRGEY